MAVRVNQNCEDIVSPAVICIALGVVEKLERGQISIRAKFGDFAKFFEQRSVRQALVSFGVGVSVSS